ncbi:unnamed protein product [Symbiodinium sp. CCMP2592]|nr:unnamed protein product [Symbiodinium sp. CCMP2592]
MAGVDVVAYGHGLTCFSQTMLLRRADGTSQFARANIGIKFDSVVRLNVACNAAASALAQASGWEEAEELLQFLSRWTQRSQISFNSCADASAKARQWRRPLHWIGTLVNSGTAERPDEVSYTASISGLKKCGRPWRTGVELLRSAASSSVEINFATCNALMGACQPGEEEDEAKLLWSPGLSLLDEMGRFSIEMTQTSCNVQLSCLEEGSKGPKARHLWMATLALFAEEEEKGWLVPDRRTQGAILGITARSLHWDGALKVLADMVHEAVGGASSADPDEAHFDLVVSACVKGASKASQMAARGLLSNTRAALMTSAAEARSRKDGTKIGKTARCKSRTRMVHYPQPLNGSEPFLGWLPNAMFSVLVPFITVVLCVFEAGAVERTRALVRRHGALAEEGTETYLTELDSDAESASPTQAKASKSWDSLPYSSFAGSIGGEKDQNASLKSVPVEGELGNSSENSDLTRKDQVEVTGAGTVVVARVKAQAPIAPTARAARASSAEADLAQAGSPKVEAAVISAQAEHSLESVEAPPVPGTGKPQAAPAPPQPTGTGPDTATTAETASASPPMAPEQPGSPPMAPLQARPGEDAATPIQMPLPATPRVLASSQPQPGQMQTSDPSQSLPAQAASRPGEASIQLQGDARQLADMPPATVQEVRPVVPLSPDASAAAGPLKPADVSGTIPAGDGAIPAKTNGATGSPAVQPEPVQSEQPASVQAPAQPLLPTRNSPLLVAGNATKEAPAPAPVQLARPAPPVSAEVVGTRSVPVNNSSPEPDSQHLLGKTVPEASAPKQGPVVTIEAAAASVVAGQASAVSDVLISVEPTGSPAPAATASNKSTITTLRSEPAQHLSIAPASLAEQGAQARQVPIASGMMPATGMATMPANGGASVMMPGMATAPVAVAAANPTTTPAPTTAAPTTAAATTAAPTTAAATTAAATTVAATTAGKEGEDEKDDDESDGGNPEGGHNGIPTQFNSLCHSHFLCLSFHASLSLSHGLLSFSLSHYHSLSLYVSLPVSLSRREAGCGASVLEEQRLCGVCESEALSSFCEPGQS